MFQANPVGFELFSYVLKHSFAPINLHSCLPREKNFLSMTEISRGRMVAAGSCYLTIASELPYQLIAD